VIQKIKYYFQKEIWQKEIEELPKSKLFLVNQVRIVVMALKGFNEDRCVLQASALTYYSLLSFVPVIAMIFGIAKGFGMEQAIDNMLRESMGAHQEIAQNVMEFSHKMLENTKGGIIAGVGVVVLFWSVIKVLGNIERSFNSIWGITKDRSLIKKFTEYLAIMVLGPILLIVASSATVLVSSAVVDLVAEMGFEYLSNGAHLILKLVPYITIWLLLALVYMVMPNTKVIWKSAFFAAVVAGTLFEVVQWGYISFQVGVAGYNAIYGSFAALPLFLAWLQLSWLIILFGGELSFAHQNVKMYRLEEESNKISLDYRKKLTLFVMHYVVKQFSEAKEAPDFDMIQQESKLPYRLLQSIVSNLENAKLVSVLKNEQYHKPRYQPAADTDLLSIDYINQALEHYGMDADIKPPDKKVYQEIDKLTFPKESRLLKNL